MRAGEELTPKLFLYWTSQRAREKWDDTLERLHRLGLNPHSRCPHLQVELTAEQQDLFFFFFLEGRLAGFGSTENV